MFLVKTPITRQLCLNFLPNKGLDRYSSDVCCRLMHRHRSRQVRLHQPHPPFGNFALQDLYKRVREFKLVVSRLLFYDRINVTMMSHRLSLPRGILVLASMAG